MVNYSNPAIDEGWAKARVEPDMAVRMAALAGLQDILAKDVAWLPVVEYKTQWAFSDKISGLRWQQDNSVRYMDLKMAE